MSEEEKKIDVAKTGEELSLLHRMFRAGIVLKGCNGIWEAATGILALTLSRHALEQSFQMFARHELLEDPNDKLIGFAMRMLRPVEGSAMNFVAIYILAHGVLNLFLAVQLYRKQHWAYRAAVAVMAIFIGYQCYRIALYHSPILLMITVFDVWFAAMTWREYQVHEKVRSRKT